MNATAQPLSRKPFEQLKVLVIDDDPFQLAVLADSLQELGLSQVTQADSGAVALRHIGQSKTAPFDLMLCDLHMPGMGGADMVRRFRQLEAGATPGRRVLVLALSANVSDAHVAECTDAGMDGHISKPLRAELVPVLLQRIRDGGAACGMLTARTE